MRKLVIATDCFLPRWDGIARFLLDIIPSLKEDWKITVLAPDYDGNMSPFAEFDDIHIVRLPLSNLKIADFIVAKAEERLIKPHIQDADLVWVHTLSTIGRSAINIGKEEHKKVIFFIHSIDHELVAKSLNLPVIVRESWYLLGKRNIMSYYNKCTALMAPSTNVEEMLEWNNIKVPKIHVNLGINLRKFTVPEDKGIAKEKIGFTKETKVIGFCGRIAKEKNVDVLIDAFKKIKAEHPDTALLIVGKGIKEIEEMAKNEPRIILAGNTDNVVPYLQAMDIFVLPSSVETTSLATLEAMSCGVTPVVTPVGYVKEYIKEKVNGIFFPFDNPSVLAIKLKWLLNNDFVRKELGKAARLTVQEKFNIFETENDIKRILDAMSD